jgi:putative MATE family efflux protein
MSETKTNTIGKEFTLLELIGFVAAPIITRLMVSLLTTLDDALFVSRFCGQNALAAFSILFPWFMLVDALGMLMLSVSTVSSIKMGQKKDEEAKSDFTTMVILAFVVGLFLTGFLLVFDDQVLLLLGETEILFPYAKTFVSVSRFYIPLILVKYVLNSFYVVAGKPKCSMIASMIDTVCQFSFDYLFIVHFKMGIVGAAYANLIGNILVVAFGTFFYSNKNHEICFARPHRQIPALMKQVIRYGRMQFITSLAISLSSYISNRVELAIGGEEIVAAFSIVSNVTFMFMNSFFGLVGSTSPIASYAYGEKSAKKLSRICKQTLVLVTGLILIIIGILYSGRGLVIRLYLTDQSSLALKEAVAYGLKAYPTALFFFGYNVFVQEFMNVVGNNRTSLFLSVIENIIFNNIFVIVLPLLMGIDGIWYSFLASEIVTFLFTAYAVYQYQDVYGYGRSGIATFVND